MNKKFLLWGSVVIVVVVLFFVIQSNQQENTTDIFTYVKRGTFKVEIETSGELEAKNSVKISGPAALRNARIWNVTIQDIIEEGSIVQSGDWVATLDRSEFQNRFDERQLALEKEQAEFTQIALDTALQLRQARDELINLKYSVEEKKIVLEQSQFEPPATIKQAEINLERAKRELQQAEENYKIKRRQNVEKMREQHTELRKAQNEFQDLEDLAQGFTIRAPKDGMVIYTKGWDNKPIKAGSQINTWDPVVATLPDLAHMMSKTYVNEVDVRKVHPGQPVAIGLDAYPDKRLTGVVTRVANVGEQRPNSDAKVFQVDIEIKGSDASLRPAMTTSNKIVANVVESALYLPLECLHSYADSVTYVYKRVGLNTTKQEVMVGLTNANEAEILAGVEEEDRIYLSIPTGLEDLKVKLIPEMDGKRRKPEPEELPLVQEAPARRPGPKGRDGQQGRRSGNRNQPGRDTTTKQDSGVRVDTPGPSEEKESPVEEKGEEGIGKDSTLVYN